jgi:N-acetyl-alpha-D-muramate 1-phosphate uridylyltransferase
MILAAGRGERMRPLSDRVPKPLLKAGGRSLIVRLVETLARAGFADIVVNVSHLGGQIERELGDGSHQRIRIAYSREEEPLETGGGIAYALPLLGPEPFVAVNSDIYCDFDFGRLRAAAAAIRSGGVSAHLVLVDNPPHHPAGDFCLDSGRVAADGAQKLTFSGIGAYDPALFGEVTRGSKRQLASLLRPAMAEGRVRGEHHRGTWMDIGTPERLAALDRRLSGAA